jgi:hypothetical protein
MTFLQSARTRAPKPPDLPPYPAGYGPRTAQHLDQRVAQYDRQISNLREELDRVQDAMLDALEEQERRDAAKRRLTKIARSKR